MEKAYTEAESGGTSYGWKKFLEEYPDHPKASAIERKIIQLEVDEIMGDSETGEMPSFESNGGGSSSGSDVQITNNTGCELTVRYSGSDVKMINIPVGSTRTVRLSSGSYRIAASACGANYAGTESLHGSYSSSFSIFLDQDSNMQPPTIVKAILAVLLLICLLDMPYGYYQLVRFVAIAGFAYLAFMANGSGRQNEMLSIYIALAILFQPIFKIALGREIWNVVDVVVAIGLAVSIFQSKK